ncbi:MAG: MFS transporter, partial [Ekhidna sp.]
MKIIQKIPKKWLIFIWILVVHLMGLLDYTLMVPLIPNITKTIGIPASQGGLWVSICALTMGITALVLSPLSDMLGRRKTLLIGLSILMISACFCGMAQNFWTLIILRGVSGVGWALILPTVIGYISDLFESEKRAMVLGIDLAFSFFAVIIGVPIYTYIAQESSWRITFLFHSFCLCFVVLLTFLIPKNPTKIVSTP